jgi:serine protease AprX
MPDTHDHLPIKVVIPHQEDLRPPRVGGGPPKDFTEFYDQARETVLTDLHKVGNYFDRVFVASNLPAVARINLREEALAKSHRPDALLTDRTCPVIGAEYFGQLLVSIRPDSLKRLVSTIATSTALNTKNDISKILSIEPFSAQDALGNWTPKELEAFLQEEKLSTLKLRMFNHRNPELNDMLYHELGRLTQRVCAGTPDALRYGRNLLVYRIRATEHSRAISELAAFVGTQSIDVFEQFAVGTQSTIVKPMLADHLPPPYEDVEYPLVGIIDTGTDPNNAHLQAWVAARDESEVPSIDQDNTHGSLVAGLIVNGRALNHDHVGFPTGRAKIVDFVALPSSGRATEDDLVELLRHAFERHPEPRIWNLSANSTNRCRNGRFSEFAIAIDGLQDEFNVMIVNSAGNINTTPLHNWRRPDLSDDDRIYSPADSLRAITVGSIAHLSRNNACAAAGEPSPFSRKGPGAAFVPKPDVTHYGGNATRDFQYSQMGVLSIDGSGNIAEAIGTSFAAPSIALSAAQLAAAFEEPPSRHLLKAFLIHSAVLHSPEVTAQDLPYKGFGKPPSVEEILRCRPWEATLVFDIDLPFSQRHFHKADFPVPPCLHHNGKVFGEILLTLVYDPPVDPFDGASYSQVNVDASLGVCWIDAKGVENYSGRKVVPYPKDYRDFLEKNQIEHGFKWSPVKVFRTRFSRLAARDTWRITLEMFARKPSANPVSQPVALIATIRDPEHRRPVYDEVVRMMNTAGWITQNLHVKEVIRVRANG